MRMRRLLPSLAPLAAGFLAAVAIAGPEQLTSSTKDSSVVRVGAPGSGVVVISSSGDLAPTGPGNADGSTEVFLLRLANRSLRQITTSIGDSSAAWVTDRGLVIVASDGDLTPGAPGNADGSNEGWVYRPGTRDADPTLTQVTSSALDSTFRTFWENGNRAYFTSKGDLTPGLPGNADGSREVYAYDVAARTLTQVTNSARDSLIRAICERSHVAVIESRGDLTPLEPGNTDGTREIFLVDLTTLEARQITSSGGNTNYAGQDATGRYIAFESDGDLTPLDVGNDDGSQEVFVHDRVTKRLRQVTRSAGDSDFVGFVPHSTMAVIRSREDLVPASEDAPGNADRTFELFTADFMTRRTVQRTASAGDSSFGGFAGNRDGLAAVVSNGDLDGGTVTVGLNQVFLLNLSTRNSLARRVTNGALDSSFRGFDPSGRMLAIETQADLVPGGLDLPGNADGSREVFVARTQGLPRLRQVTSSTRDSFFAAFVADGRTMLVNSHGDFVPVGGPGNADGSLEVFRLRYR